MQTKRDRGEGWIGVDLDGTLANDSDKSKSFDPSYVGPPIDRMVKKVRKWLDEGKEVRLFTARTPHPAIRRWMKEHLGQVLPITNHKQPGMQAMYDDRAVQVKRNQGHTNQSDEDQVWGKS